MTTEAPPDGRQWYVIHTYAGYENKVKQNLEHRIKSMGVDQLIFRVEIPVEDEIEIKNGKRNTVQRKLYPGYVLVEMLMDDQTWSVVRNTPGVTGFVSSGNKPVPIQEREISNILESLESPRLVKPTWQKGEVVRVTAGPFAEFTGTIEEVNADKEKVKVLISIFGRDTPVELDFNQIERV